jgi:hypothetical protein
MFGIERFSQSESASEAVHGTRHVYMHGNMRESHARFFELKRGEMRANELADREHHANLQPFFSCGL